MGALQNYMAIPSLPIFSLTAFKNNTRNDNSFYTNNFHASSFASLQVVSRFLKCSVESLAFKAKVNFIN